MPLEQLVVGFKGQFLGAERVRGTHLLPELVKGVWETLYSYWEVEALHSNCGRGQLGMAGSLLPHCGSWGLNSGS